MKTPRRPVSARPTATIEVDELRARLAEAEDTLRAIRNGEVDSVIGVPRKGPRVFTLEGADHAYRVLIESMNEGALTLTADKVILYANRRFAEMVRLPLEQVIGGEPGRKGYRRRGGFRGPPQRQRRELARSRALGREDPIGEQWSLREVGRRRD